MSSTVKLSDLGAKEVRFSKDQPLAASTRAYQTLDQAFPKVEPEHEPFGNLVLVQIRTAMTRTAGGIELVPGDQETEKWNTQVAKVIAVGPVAFKNRDSMEPWPEGAWFKVGDFVRCPKYGGDRFEVPIPGSPDKAVFAIFEDNDFRARLTGDPLKVVAYI